MSPAIAPSTTSSCGDAGAGQLPRPSAARPAAAGASRRPGRATAPRSCSARITASAVPWPPAARAPVLQWVAIRVAPASSSAPWAAIAAEAASSSAWMRSASRARGRGHRRRPGRQRRGAHAVDGVGQVDRGRPRRAQQLPAALERPEAGLAAPPPWPARRRRRSRSAARRGRPGAGWPAPCRRAPSSASHTSARGQRASGRAPPGGARPSAGPDGAASRRTWRQRTRAPIVSASRSTRGGCAWPARRPSAAAFWKLRSIARGPHMKTDSSRAVGVGGGEDALGREAPVDARVDQMGAQRLVAVGDRADLVGERRRRRRRCRRSRRDGAAGDRRARAAS